MTMKTQMFSIQDDAPLVEQAKLRASLTLVPDVSNYEDLERPAPGVAARGVHETAMLAGATARSWAVAWSAPTRAT